MKEIEKLLDKIEDQAFRAQLEKAITNAIKDKCSDISYEIFTFKKSKECTNCRTISEALTKLETRLETVLK